MDRRDELESIEWRTETWKIKDLHNNERNPRRLTKERAERLRTSIERFGLCEPIVVNLDGSIIGGHQRVATLKKMKQKEISVSVPDRQLNDQEGYELCLRLNKNTGEWDYDLLANDADLDVLYDVGFTAQDLGFDMEPLKEPENKEKEQKKCPNCGHLLG